MITPEKHDDTAKKPLQEVTRSSNFDIYQEAAAKVGNVHISLTEKQAYDDGRSLPEDYSMVEIKNLHPTNDLTSFWKEVHALQAAAIE